jgi:hypothetical protein
MTDVLTMRIGLGSEAIDLRMVDYPGEDFRTSLRRLERERVRELYEHYAQSEAILLLFDPDRDVRAVGDPVHREEQIERQSAHLNAIAELWAEQSGTPSPQQRKPVDVAIIITKSDKEPELTTCLSARRFFRRLAGPLDQKICQQADAVEYFPLSAIGNATTAERDGKAELLPGRDLVPTGYEEILRWVIRRRRWRRWRPWVRRVIAAAIVIIIVGAAICGWNWSKQSAALAILNDPAIPRIEKLTRTLGYSDAAVLQARAKVFQEELAVLKESLDSAIPEGAVDEVLQRADSLAMLEPRAMQGDVDSLKSDCRHKQADILFSGANDGFAARRPDFPKLAARFLNDCTGDSRCDDVRRMLREWRGREQEDARAQIKQIRVTAAPSLAEKGKRIAEFVSKFGDVLTSEEKGRMRKAADLARRFSELNWYTVRLKQTSGLTKPYHQGIVLQVNGQVVGEYKSPGMAQEVNWEEGGTRFQWSAGQPIRLTWKALRVTWTWGDSDIAVLRDDGPLALGIVGGRQGLTQFEDGWPKYCENAFVHFEVEEIKEDDWTSVGLYLFPGAGW